MVGVGGGEFIKEKGTEAGFRKDGGKCLGWDLSRERAGGDGKEVVRGKWLG
jgi:hypothetical protein